MPVAWIASALIVYTCVFVSCLCALRHARHDAHQASTALGAAEGLAADRLGGMTISGLLEIAADISVVTADGRVMLDGPIEVLAGSRERRRMWGGSVERQLDNGARVRVFGLLRREGAAAGYRQDAARWRMTAFAEESRILVVAEGTPRVVGPWLGRVLRGAVIGAALAWTADAKGLWWGLAPPYVSKCPYGVHHPCCAWDPPRPECDTDRACSLRSQSRSGVKDDGTLE